MGYTQREKPGIMFYWSTFEALDRLKDQELRQMLKAMRDYGKDGVVPDFGDNARLELVWPFFQEDIEKDHNRYMEKKRKNSEAGAKGAAARWGKEEPDTEPPTYMPYGV